jgi:hypothetical protein
MSVLLSRVLCATFAARRSLIASICFGLTRASGNLILRSRSTC